MRDFQDVRPSGSQRVRALAGPQPFVPVVPPDVRLVGAAAAAATPAGCDAVPAATPPPRAPARPAAGRHRSPSPGRHPVAALVDRVPPAVRVALAGRRLQRRHVALLLVVGALAVAVAVLVVRVSLPATQAVPAGLHEPALVATGTPASGLPSAAPTAEATTAPGAGGSESAGGDAGEPLTVHVAGLVARPGIVRLPGGSRVLDALDAAGGAQPGVDLTALNLARRVVDGEQVLVGVPAGAGDPLAAGGAAAGGAATGGGSAAAGGAPSPASPVDLNTADTAALEALPGVGPVLAGRIVAWRSEHGRFRHVEELREVSGIGTKTFEALRPLVRV